MDCMSDNELRELVKMVKVEEEMENMPCRANQEEGESCISEKERQRRNQYLRWI